MEGSYDNTPSIQQDNNVRYNSSNENYQDNANYRTVSDIDNESVSQVASLWSQYHNDRNIIKLTSLYANQVNYYQSSYTKEQIKTSKEKLLNKYPDFRQEISNVIVKNESSYYAVYFDKKVKWNKMVERGMQKDFSWQNSRISRSMWTVRLPMKRQRFFCSVRQTAWTMTVFPS